MFTYNNLRHMLTDNNLRNMLTDNNIRHMLTDQNLQHMLTDNNLPHTLTDNNLRHMFSIHGISIDASTLDWGMTKGLCGIFNNDPRDDFTPIRQFGPVDERRFGKSWK
jgi:hypothetical protein